MTTSSRFLKEQEADTRQGVAFSWFMIWTAFYIYNLINDGAATYKADQLMPASEIESKTVVMWFLSISTVFSALSATGGIYLNIVKLLKLVGSPEFHFKFHPRCGADNVHSFNRALPTNKIPTDPQDETERAGNFQKILREYEFRSMGVSAVALCENLIQTIILISAFDCQPVAAGYAQVLHGFQASCFVLFARILLTSVMYIRSHEGWGWSCKCVYPSIWFRRVLCVQGCVQIVISCVCLIIVIVSMARSVESCSLI